MSSGSAHLGIGLDRPVGIDYDPSIQPVPIGANPPELQTVEVSPPRVAAPEAAAPEGVLAEALRITDGARQRDYGSAATNHQRIALFWKVWDICKLGSDKTIEEALAVLRAEFENLPTDDSEAGVATKMVLLKLARQANTPKRDNLVDIAGYTRCLSRILHYEE